jgi:hypothetical protein
MLRLGKSLLLPPAGIRPIQGQGIALRNLQTGQHMWVYLTVAYQFPAASNTSFSAHMLITAFKLSMNFLLSIIFSFALERVH